MPTGGKSRFVQNKNCDVVYIVFEADGWLQCIGSLTNANRVSEFRRSRRLLQTSSQRFVGDRDGILKRLGQPQSNCFCMHLAKDLPIRGIGYMRERMDFFRPLLGLLAIANTGQSAASLTDERPKGQTQSSYTKSLPGLSPREYPERPGCCLSSCQSGTVDKFR